MRQKIIAAALVLTGVIAGGARAQMYQDVYIDLSALDSLESDSTPIYSQPLFPEVKKASAINKPAVKKASAVKKVKKPAKAAKVKAAQAVKVTVAPQVEAKVETKPVEAKPAVVEKVEATSAAPAALVEPTALPQAEEVAQVVPVKEAVKESAPQTDELKAAEDMVKDADTPVVKTPAEEEVKVVDVEPSTNPVKVVDVEPVASNQVAAKPQESVKSNALLIEQRTTDHVLKFAPDVAELTPEQQAQIDAIINSFDDAANNKIAILSYNINDGIDAFKKKRLSLNRAVEVRGYLLQQGHKNFSIKVINVEKDSGKANTVEIEELK